MLIMWTAIMTVPDEDDREFIQRLFLENKMVMFVTARNIVKDYHTARDMVSESCITMIEKIKYLREISAEKQTPYIISIVRNNSLMYLRRRQREVELLKESWYIFEHDVTEIQKSVDSRLITEAEMQELKEALSGIYKRDSELLKMKYLEKLPDDQIAKIIGIGTASVRFYLTKARRNLEEEIKRRREV